MGYTVDLDMLIPFSFPLPKEKGSRPDKRGGRRFGVARFVFQYRTVKGLVYWLVFDVFGFFSLTESYEQRRLNGHLIRVAISLLNTLIFR